MTSARRERIWTVIAILAVAAVLLLPLALISLGEVFSYSVGPNQIADTFKIERREGTSIEFANHALTFSELAIYDVSHPGYESQRLEFSRKSDQRQVHVELIPLPGYLDVIVSQEFPVKIHINEIPQSQLTGIELAQGRHVVSIFRDETKLTSQVVEIEGLGKSQQIAFDLVEFQSRLRVATNPSLATIELNGSVVGQGKFDGWIASGQSQLRIYRHGYHPKVVDIDIKPAQILDLDTISLTPSDISLAVESTPGNASVLIDGTFVGETSLSHLLHPNRSYELVVRKPGYREHREVLTPTAGKNLTRAVQFSRDKVHYEINIEPEGDVFVNGMKQGRAPQAIDIYPGDLIEARQDGLVPQTLSATAGSGSKQTVTFTLLKPSDHAYQFAPEKATVTGSLELIRFPPVRYRKLIDAASEATSLVTITRPFYIGATEVTVDAYKRFRPGAQGTANQPIVNVTWLDAVKFCNWLSSQHGLDPFYFIDADNIVEPVVAALGFRLPTEAEWETGASYNWESHQIVEPYEWGSMATIPIGFANLAGQETAKVRARYINGFVDNHIEMAPVASYRPNFNGLYDMTGNVAEWVHDYYEIRRTVNASADFLGPRAGFSNTVKGSSYETDELSEITTHYRKFETNKRATIGFRVARWIY